MWIFFWQTTSGSISVFSKLLGPTVDTCYASVYGVAEFQVFQREQVLGWFCW